MMMMAMPAVRGSYPFAPPLLSRRAVPRVGASRRGAPVACAAGNGDGNGEAAGDKSEPGDMLAKAAAVSSFRAQMAKQWEKEEQARIDQKLEEARNAAKKTCSKPESDVIDCRLSWEAVDEIRQAKERKAFYRDMAEAQEAQERAEVEAAADLALRRRRLEEELSIPPAAAEEKPAQAASAAAEPAPERTDEKDKPDRAHSLMQDEMPCKSESECSPPTGSFLQAGKLEKMFGGGTREQFEQMMRNLGHGDNKSPGPEEFRDLDKHDDPDPQRPDA